MANNFLPIYYLLNKHKSKLNTDTWYLQIVMYWCWNFVSDIIVWVCRLKIQWFPYNNNCISWPILRKFQCNYNLLIHVHSDYLFFSFVLRVKLSACSMPTYLISSCCAPDIRGSIWGQHLKFEISSPILISVIFLKHDLTYLLLSPWKKGS